MSIRKRKKPNVEKMKISQEIKNSLDLWKARTGLQYGDAQLTDEEARQEYIDNCRDYLKDLG